MTTIDLLSSILVGGGATLTATQILKSKYIPIQFEKYPRQTAATVALISSMIAEYQSGVTVNVHNIPGFISIFVGTLWIAISVYDHLTNSN